MANRLTKRTLNAIRNDNQLSLLVADELDIKLSSLPSQLYRPTRRLTEYAILKIISDYLGTPVQELVEEYDEDRVENSVTNIQKVAQ